MSFNITKRTLVSRTILSSILAASSISTLSFAQQQEGFTLTPSIGHYNMDNDRNIKDDAAYSLGLGYQFDNPWAIEFVYLNADTTQAGTGNKVDVDQYRLDGLYHLPSISALNLTPYLAAGVGTTDFGGASDDNNVQINAGGGLKYAVNNTVSLRADFRVVNDVEDNHLDHISSLGVQMTFGNSANRSQPNAENKVAEPEARAYTAKTVKDTTETANEAQYQAPKETTPTTSEEETKATTTTVVMSSEPTMDQNTAPLSDSDVNKTPVTSATQSDQPIATEQTAAVEAPAPLRLNIQFGNNKTDVEQAFYPEIEKLAQYLKENPSSTVVIEGHTDNTGAASYNQTLSEKRAQAVASVLINIFDVEQDRVDAIGYGQSEPLFDNDSAENRMANRRVDAVITDN